MAEVQLALQRGPAGFEKLVVVKLVHENLASQKPFVDMLLDEARVAALVKHPNVVDIYDLGEVDGRYFIAMEYLEGEPLLAVLRAGRDGQRLDVMSTARLIADTAEGLDAAHELRSLAGDPIELVHHDVSLGNIVVLYNGQVKLVDFGVAKATQSASTRNTVQGKFSYMAPEKLRGGAGDRRSDIWSLGCVLWEALTLKRLFKAATDRETRQQVLEGPIQAPSAANPDVAPAFDAIVLRALERDPARRYPTAKAMAEELEQVLQAHGYAAKNDQIARYMQSAFSTHIAARKKLLQEVSSKGRASPDLVEAAFHDGALATGTPSVGPSDSWTVRKLDSPGLIAPLVTAPAVEPDAAATVIDAPLVIAAPAGELAVADAPLAPLPRRVPGAAKVTGAIAVVGAIALVIALLVRASSTRSEPAGRIAARPVEPVAAPGVAAPVEPAPAPGVAAPVEPAPVEPVAAPVEPAPVEPVAAPGMQAPVEPARAVAPPPEAAEPASPASERRATRAAANRRPERKLDKADKPVDKVLAEDVFKQGVQAYVHGDTRTALASYKRAIQADAGFAPAYRGLGLVYEKLGDRPAARAAFKTYLKLAPAASDADSIRARLDPS
jgi:serine/threonine-protein kinase